jgi:hypothetical protein
MINAGIVVVLDTDTANAEKREPCSVIAAELQTPRSPTVETARGRETARGVGSTEVESTPRINTDDTHGMVSLVGQGNRFIFFT